MITEVFGMTTEIVASDNGTHTYEIKRTWENGCLGKAIIIELYPTISIERKECLDLSTMHLMNHVTQFDWKEVRIINLFSMVFSYKPLACQLMTDIENLAYIEDMLEEDGIEEYDIVISWGSTLKNHAVTKETKRELLAMIQNKGLSCQVKQISVDGLKTNEQMCPHPLYLGLRHAKDRWFLVDFPLEDVLAELYAKKPKQEKKKGAKKNKEVGTAEQEETLLMEQKTEQEAEQEKEQEEGLENVGDKTEPEGADIVGTDESNGKSKRKSKR